MSQHASDRDDRSFCGPVRANPQDAAIDRFDFLQRLLSLQLEKRLAGADQLAVGFEPANEGAFLH
jgi:hypothetical protein